MRIVAQPGADRLQLTQAIVEHATRREHQQVILWHAQPVHGPYVRRGVKVEHVREEAFDREEHHAVMDGPAVGCHHHGRAILVPTQVRGVAANLEGKLLPQRPIDFIRCVSQSAWVRNSINLGPQS